MVVCGLWAGTECRARSNILRRLEPENGLVVFPIPNHLRSFAILAPKLETTAHWLETGVPDPADELAALVLEYGRRPLPRRATQLARKALGGNVRE